MSELRFLIASFLLVLIYTRSMKLVAFSQLKVFKKGTEYPRSEKVVPEPRMDSMSFADGEEFPPKSAKR